MSAAKAKKFIYLIFACVFLCMLLFNFMTPMAGDDYAHYYGMLDTHPTSIQEIIENLKIFRQTGNGRVVSHFLVYLFLIPPRSLFSIINAVNTILVVWLFNRYFNDQNEQKNLVLLLISIFLVWCFMPGFGEVFLWYTGSINYSWGLTIFLFYLYPFFRNYMDGSDSGSAVTLCLLGLIAGAYSENGAAASIFVSIIFILAARMSGQKVNKKYYLAVLCSIVGFIFLMTAPSETGTRTGELTLEAIINSLNNCIALTWKYCWGLWVLYAVLVLILIWKKTGKKQIISSLIFVCGATLSIIVFAFAAYIPRRSFYIMTIYMTIACMLLLSTLWGRDYSKAIIALAAALFVLFGYRFVYGAYDISKLYYQSRMREKTIAEAIEEGNLNVSLQEYTTGTAYSEISYEELEENPDWWYNSLLARYYGLESVTGIIVQ